MRESERNGFARTPKGQMAVSVRKKKKEEKKRRRFGIRNSSLKGLVKGSEQRGQPICAVW